MDIWHLRWGEHVYLGGKNMQLRKESRACEKDFGVTIAVNLQEKAPVLADLLLLLSCLPLLEKEDHCSRVLEHSLHKSKVELSLNPHLGLGRRASLSGVGYEGKNSLFLNLRIMPLWWERDWTLSIFTLVCVGGGGVEGDSRALRPSMAVSLYRNRCMNPAQEVEMRPDFGTWEMSLC